MKNQFKRALVGTLVATCLTGTIVRGEEPSETKTPTFWDRVLFRDTKTKTVETESTDKSKATENDEAMVLYHQASRRAREESDYFRRLDACDRLMEIAIQRNDMAMQRQVEELQSRVQDVYNKRTSFLTTNPSATDEASLSKSLAKESKSSWGFTGRFGREKPKDLESTATAENKKKSKKEDNE